MKYECASELESKAAILSPKAEARKLSRRERIEKWVSLLEAHPEPLTPFAGIEYLSGEARRALRADNSPLALAFGDPVLRADGLSSDRLGDGMAYFGLSERKVHWLLCDCHYCGSMTGELVASRLREASRPGIGERLWRWATGRDPIAA